MSRREPLRPLAVLAAALLAATAALLVCASPALGLTNNATTLDVGAGESISLSGTQTYTTSVTIHDGGTVCVDGALTLVSPSVTIGASSSLYGTGLGADGAGAVIVIQCTTLTVSGTVVSDGWAGTTVWPTSGRAGGSITVSATRETSVAAGGIFARGGGGYVFSGDGGPGGGISIVTPRFTVSGTGTLSVNGGSAASNTGYSGGDAGTITLRSGRYAQPAGISARGGNGSSQDGPFGIGGDGGDGGTVAVTADHEITPAGTVDVSGGTAGYGEEHTGVPGATGTVTHTLSTAAPYDVATNINGYIPTASPTEYYRSWYWDIMLDMASEVWLHEDGTNLRVGVHHTGVANGYMWLVFDTTDNGGSAPQTDDRAFLIGTGMNRGQTQEYVGTGSTWTLTGSTWSGTSAQNGSADDCEWSIPLTRLGITPGNARTIGFAIAWVSSTNTEVSWPSGSSRSNPGTWPDLSSPDAWTLTGNVPPAGWTGFAPTVTNDSTPDCSIQVVDATLGLDVSTAQYRCSTDGGSTWSAWAAAACTGSDGTMSPQTLTASGVPLLVSLTANRVQFRVYDMGGAAGESAACAVAIDTVVPTPWAGFSPVATVTNTLAPNCTITIRDAGSGLGVATAQYQYSTNGGSSWSGWIGASCTGTSGTTATQTVTAYAVPFLQNSLTANRIRFRVNDLAGNTAASASYTVPIDANVFGMPVNGDFEFGNPGSVPVAWVSSTSTDYGGGSGTFANTCEVINYSRFHGTQSARGQIQLAAYTSGRAYSAEQVMRTSSALDLTGVSRIDLAMLGTAAGQSGTTPSSWDHSVSLRFSDGVNPVQTVTLWRTTNSGTTDTRTGTAVGADGATWSVYQVTVPGGLNLANTTLSVVWRVSAVTAGTDTVFSCQSQIDWIRVWDTVPPASAASVPGNAWSDGLSRDVSFLATDSVGLASVQLWSRLDTGSGFGPWTQDQTRSAIGTSVTGSFNTLTASEGRYEFYTRAIDSSGNVEAAPGAADAWCAVDRTAPRFGNLTPSGWTADPTPPVTLDVRDTGAGLGLTPQVVGTLPELTKLTASEATGTTLYAAGGSTVFTIDVSAPTAPAEAKSVDLSFDITSLAVDPSRPWLYAALGTRGIAALGTVDPLEPRVAAVTEELGDIRYLAASDDGPSPLLFAASTTDLWILDASRPDSPMRVLSRTGFPTISDIAYHHGLLYVQAVDGPVFSVDPRRPEDPLVSEGPPAYGAAHIALGGDLLFVADNDATLMVYDISRAPDTWTAVTPDRVSHLFSAPAASLRVSGDRLYAALDAGDVPVIDVGTPSAPTLIRQLDGGHGLTRSVALLGHLVVTINDDAGLKVWQCAEPVYRWSSNGGATWSDWFAATRAYAEGSSATQTLTASRVAFDGDSGTSNVVEFATADMLGRMGSSGALPIRLDTTPPRVMGPMSSTHSNPASWYPATTVGVSWGAYVDLSGIVGYAHAWDDSPATALPSVVTTTAMMTTRTGAAEGVHYFHVRPVDAAGNWGDTAHLAYRVDCNPPTAPTGLVVSPAASTTNTFSASWSNPAQTFAPLDACYYRLDSLPASSTDGTLVAGTPTGLSGLTASSEGTHTLYVWLRDSAGNASQTNRASATFVYDASAPAAPVITSATHPDQNAWYATSPATFSWTASDSVSAIDGYSWGFDSDPSGAPDYLSDGTVPSASYARPGDGDYYLHVRARNAVGLWGAVATYRVRWDTAAPSGTMMVDGGSEATSRTAAVANSAVSDLSPMTMRASTSGGATWTASVPYATTLGVTLPAGDGVKTVIVAYTDSAGNVRSLTDTITLDTAAPQGSFHLENDAVYTRSAAVTASASITDLTAVSMRYSLDSGSTWMAWEPFSAEKRLTLPAGDGAKLVLGQYLDAAGNLMQTSDGITLDTAAPTLDAESTTHPSASTWYDDDAPAFSWLGTDGLSGVDGYSWALNASAGTPADTVVDGSGTSEAYAALADGTWYFHVRARDVAGNWSADIVVTVRVDTGAPSGSIAVNGGAAVSTSANVTVTNAVTDASPLTMRFSTDGKASWSTAEAYAGTKSLTLPSVDGTVTVWARFTDATGHVLETSDAIVLDLTTEMDRIAGDNRYETAALVSESNFAAGSCDYVVVATGAKFPDALGAAGLAGSYDCPLLLTDPNTLPAAIRDEIIRCGANDCFIIGSTAAVTDAVKSAIDAIPGMNTPVRLAGNNRYETAAAVAAQIALHEGPAFSRRAFIARGDNFADALASSPLAYATASPVLLVQTTALPATTGSAIVSLGITDVVIAGSDKAVAENVKSAIDALPGVNTPTRVFGSDRYATAAAVATYGVNRGWASWGFLGVATGLNFPDALGGGAACGSRGGVLLLTASTSLSTPCRDTITAHANDIGTVQVFGGPSALSAGVYNLIHGLVQ